MIETNKIRSIYTVLAQSHWFSSWRKQITVVSTWNRTVSYIYDWPGSARSIHAKAKQGRHKRRINIRECITRILSFLFNFVFYYAKLSHVSISISIIGEVKFDYAFSLFPFSLFISLLSTLNYNVNEAWNFFQSNFSKPNFLIVFN